MKLSEYLKPALGVAFFVALAGGYYWFDHRSKPQEKDTPEEALVVVTKSTNACFSDLVRVTGHFVPRREAVEKQALVDLVTTTSASSGGWRSTWAEPTRPFWRSEPPSNAIPDSNKHI